MIPHKNLFSGALGKFQNIGGSRIYTTPHTVSVPAEYSINVSYNVQGDLVGHSLDGRLWLYRRSRRLGVIALTWDDAKGKLEYAAAQNISNNDDIVLACGIDWVLTNNNIFMVSDEEPYIRSTRLFDANIPDTFLYSILRAGNIGMSGIDPFTGEAWGKREDNGNSEGTGYFSKSTHLLYPAGSHKFEQYYSLLPAVGIWQIFENFLVRRPDAETITSYNYMQAVSPLIPLEFANGTAVYGTGYNFDHRGIQLAHRKGEIFGKGFQNIGKVSLLPAVFGEDGSVQEYYLYISPDFTFHPYSDFFYCNISIFDVNTNDEQVTHSFAVSLVARTWADAKTICEALGGHLATSTSAEKNSFLASLIGNKTVWIGGSDQDTEGAWKWITGEEWKYTNWNSGEPNNSGDEDFLELQPSGKWNDSKSANTHYYICEWDYELKENDFLGCLWPNIAIAPVGNEALYGFVSEQNNVLNGAYCFRSEDGRVLIPQTGELLTLSEDNARIFFDALSCKGLLLDDDGGQLLLGETISDTQNFECRTIPQWLAPADKIDAITGEYVVASADNAVLCTSLVTGFNRQFISPNTIPLTARVFQDSLENSYRIALYEGVNTNNRKVFGVNKILAQDVTQEAIKWQDIYTEAVKIKLLSYFDTGLDHNSGGAVFASNWTVTPIFSAGTEFYSSRKWFTTKSINWWADAYMDVWDTACFDSPELDTANVYGGSYSVNRIHPKYVDKIYDHVDTDIYFIDPDTGQMSEIQHISFSVPNSIVLKTVHYSGSGWYGYAYVPIQYDYQDISEESTLYHEFELCIHEHAIYITATNYFTGEQVFFYVRDVPDNIKPYTYTDITPSILCNKIIVDGNGIVQNNYLPEELSSRKFHCLFSEYFSQTILAYDISSRSDFQSISEILKGAGIFYIHSCYNGINGRLINGIFVSNISLYIVIFCSDKVHGMRFLVFRTETDPDIFDFYTETERSKSH